MSDKDKHDKEKSPGTEPETAADPDTPEVGEPPAEALEGAEPETVPPRPEAEENPDEAARLAAQLAETRDKYLRLAAEFDNYRKRTVRQFESVIRTANDELVLELIAVMDNFELALEAAKTSDGFSAFHQGVELIFKQLNELMAKRGLKTIEALGREFDPQVHEAVRQDEDPEQPSNTVMQEVQKGYRLGDRVIRPAKVVVNK